MQFEYDSKSNRNIEYDTIQIKNNNIFVLFDCVLREVSSFRTRSLLHDCTNINSITHRAWRYANDCNNLNSQVIQKPISIIKMLGFVMIL